MSRKIHDSRNSGITRSEFLQTGQLPEGFYTFTIEVVDARRGAVLSNGGMAMAFIELNDPPLINLPILCWCELVARTYQQ